MNLNEYQDLAAKTAGSHFSHEQALCNWVMGLCGEAGEFTELIKKELFHGRIITSEEKVKELGDVLWYLAMCAKESGFTLDYIAERNITKLSERYPDKFTLGGGIR